ncbi:MAG: acyl-CoA dehydrogenase family protein [Acidimicrobiia bacterium]
MEPDISDEQEFFAETTRKFLTDKADVTALRSLRHDPMGYDASYWTQGCELGWVSLLVSEEDGGGSISGEAIMDLALVAYEFGRQAGPGPLLSQNAVAYALSQGGTDQQKADVLGGVMMGEIRVGWGPSGPSAGDRADRLPVSAVASGDGYTLNGTALPVESGNTSQYFLVAADTDQGKTQFLVPADSAGVSVAAMGTVDLTKRFSAVTFTNVSVPSSAVVGTVGGAAIDVARQLQIVNALQAAEMTGALDTAMEITIEWMHNRYSFGRPLASYQALKHRFAEMKMWQEASHAIADAAAHAVQDNTDDAARLVSAAKAYIGQYGPELCHECIQMHGGIGVTFDHDLHLYLRRVSLNASLYGSVNDHRLQLADIVDSHKEAVA